MLLLYLSAMESAEERERFTVIYEKWRKAMYYTALQTLRDPSLAEDAVHDAFFYVARHMEKIGAADSPETKAYLTLAARSYALHILKRRQDYVDSELVDWQLEEQEPDGSVEDLFFDSYDVSQLRELIGELPEKYRTPLLLHCAAGHSCAEIAEIMDLQPDAARQRISRAKKLLRQALQETAKEEAIQ